MKRKMGRGIEGGNSEPVALVEIPSTRVGRTTTKLGSDTLILNILV